MTRSPARARVHADRQRGDTEARCQDTCQFWRIYLKRPDGIEALASASSPSEVRTAARQHAAETGHVVEVTVEDVTRYGPEDL